MHFDQEQLDAINTTGQSVLVSASAGAGKTGVLIARLMKRCTMDRIPIQSILAVTFTEAAANEMKKRLAKELHNRIAETNDEELIAYLQQQLIALSAASITTIDSYCLSIIQKYYNVIGLNPSSAKNVLPEGIKENMQQEAFLTCFDELHQNNPTMATTLASYFSNRPEDYASLYEVVKDINRCAESVIEPDTWYQQLKEYYPTIKHFTEFSQEILDSFYLSYSLKLHNLDSYLAQMEAFSTDEPEATKLAVKQKRVAVQNCLNAADEKNYTMLCSSIVTLAQIKTKTSKEPHYKKNRESMNELMKKIVESCYTEQQFISDENELSSIVSSLVDLAKHSHEQFQTKKKQLACIDFSDMERYALDILTKNNGETATVIRNSFQEIMIDEFQDTSELQSEIIAKISRDDNVFRVGDVKQSIYAFRQAKPSLMRSLMQDGKNHLVTLRHNYRSRESIVQFTNLLFEKLMNVPGAKDTYSELDHVTIGDTKRQGEPEPVPVIFADVQIPEEFVAVDDNAKEPDSEEEKKEEEESASSKELKAAWIAGKIIELCKEDPSISYRDIAILTRAHADKLYLKSAFDHANIPYDIDTREGFYQSQLCQTIIAMCSFMSDSTDIISLLAILTSSFYNLSDEELAQLKIKYGSLYKGVQAEYPIVLQEMDELKHLCDTDGVVAMLTEIANRHDFYNLLDNNQKANFDYLFEQTITNAPENLFAFKETMQVSEEEKSSEAMSKGKDDDVVTVTTIHHSKGLQYPIVFLWSTSRNDFRNKKKAVLVSENLGLGMKHIDVQWGLQRPTVQRLAVEYQMDLEDQEEFTRLLYVALTRAERRLFIVDTLSKDISPQPITLSLLAARKGMTGLVLSAFYDNAYYKHEIVNADLSITTTPYKDTGKEKLPHLDIQPEVFSKVSSPSSTETSKLLPLDLTVQTSGKAYGTLMHETIANLPNKVWTEEQVKDSPNPQALLAFSQSDLYQQCLKGEIHKEYPFYIEQNDMHCVGTIDFFSVVDKKVYLIDFKTDNASMEEIANRYSEQLNTYRKALQILYPTHEVVTYAYSFHNNTSIEIEEN